MITDAFGTFTDNKAVTATGNSEVVSLMPFSGIGESVNVTVLVTSPYNNGATMTVNVQESDDGVSFTTTASFVFKELTKMDPRLSFSLPQETRAQFVRLNYVVAGATAGKLWAGVTREQIGWYRRGLYISKGKVVL
jgi:hypothetical protein